MKRLISMALSAAALGAVISATPAAAQVAGNPGDNHTRTLYMDQYGHSIGQTAAGPTAAYPGGFPAFASQNPPQCGVIQDFNGRYTALCGL